MTVEGEKKRARLKDGPGAAFALQDARSAILARARRPSPLGRDEDAHDGGWRTGERT
jgi:hypothetical protein